MKVDKIAYRDRGFQKGDGFHMVLAQPKPEHQLTDEFFVFGFSPRKDGEVDKLVWYHDVDLSFNGDRIAGYESAEKWDINPLTYLK